MAVAVFSLIDWKKSATISDRAAEAEEQYFRVVSSSLAQIHKAAPAPTHYCQPLTDVFLPAIEYRIASGSSLVAHTPDRMRDKDAVPR